MSLNVPLLRSSFELVVERQPQLTRRFYEILFQRYPQTKPLFHRNKPEAQEKMLTDALVAVMDRLHFHHRRGPPIGGVVAGKLAKGSFGQGFRRHWQKLTFEDAFGVRGQRQARDGAGDHFERRILDRAGELVL